MDAYVRERRSMVRDQIVARGIRDHEVLRAMMTVPREHFAPPSLSAHAYDDAPLPLGEHHQMSPAFVVAEMAEAARLSLGDRVLDVGTGSGYAAAVYAELASIVYTIECDERLQRRAVALLDTLGYQNVLSVLGDGSLGLVNAAPFDAILVAAADETIPDALLDQLAIGGRLVAPMGTAAGSQTLVRVERVSREHFTRERLIDVALEPLLHGVEHEARATMSVARR